MADDTAYPQGARPPGHITEEEAGDEVQAFMTAIMGGIHNVARARIDAKLNLHLPCVITALVSVLGHHVAGVEEERRADLYAQIGEQLQTSINQSAATPGAHARVFDNSKWEGPIQ